MKVSEVITSSEVDFIDGVSYGFNPEKNSIAVKGKVWVGDPCYPPVFNRHWTDGDMNPIGWLKAFWAAEKALEDEESSTASVVVTVNGIEMVAGSTSEGDGCYPIEGEGSEVGVDAGLLCVIPEAMFEFAGLDGEEDHGGCYLDNLDGTAEIDEDATLWIGYDYKVITKERCENCHGISDECGCEKCWECGEWQDYCTCEDTCIGCGMAESECCCDDCDEEEED